MRPEGLSTKIFLDSGNPSDTDEVLSTSGFLDGQTTNPSLVAKNPQVEERVKSGNKFKTEEIYDMYRSIVQDISKKIPNGSVSIEVYSDKDTKAEDMISWGEKMFSWIPNAHIKLPITKEGLKTAETLVKNGKRVNMTLCFSEEQAVAVYNATLGAKKGDVFISPFVGRLDDRGENGMDLIKNITELYKDGDGHVEVLVASVRNMNHFSQSLDLKADIITAPKKIIEEWSATGMKIEGGLQNVQDEALSNIEKKNLSLDTAWQECDIYHELTEKGLDKFAEDWNTLIDK